MIINKIFDLFLSIYKTKYLFYPQNIIYIIKNLFFQKFKPLLHHINMELNFTLKNTTLNMTHNNGWDVIFFSSLVKIDSNAISLMKALVNPHLLFNLTPDRKVIIYLPFLRQINGIVLKRALIGELEGPIIQGNVIKYRISSSNFKYLISFEVREETDYYTELFVYSYLMIKFGILDRLLMPDKNRALQLLSPERLVRNILHNIVTIISV